MSRDRKDITFNGIKVKSTYTDIEVIQRCPYCNKKFLHKNSYRNHILGDYCKMFDLEKQESLDKTVYIPLNHMGSDKNG